VRANILVLDAKQQKREVKHQTCFQADFHAAFLFVYVDFSSVVEVGLVPAQLTAYDAAWLKVT